MNLEEKLKLATDLLVEFHDKEKYRQPNSDWYEYCNGCHKSPYNVPQHADDCIVVRLIAALKVLRGE